MRSPQNPAGSRVTSERAVASKNYDPPGETTRRNFIPPFTLVSEGNSRGQVYFCWTECEFRRGNELDDLKLVSRGPVVLSFVRHFGVFDCSAAGFGLNVEQALEFGGNGNGIVIIVMLLSRTVHRRRYSQE